MAQKKIVLELSIVESEHLRGALGLAQINHEDQMKRPNPALTRVQAKLEKAVSASLAPEKKSKGAEDAGDEKPDADAD